MKFKNSRGITLIALVITIIILIILTGVAINLSFGENGIFKKARVAKEEYNNAVKSEEEELNEIYAYLNGNMDSFPENTTDTEPGTLVKIPDGWLKVTPNYVSTEDGSIKIASTREVESVYAVASGNGETIPVPVGFWYVGGNTNTGVVISDKEADSYKKHGKDMTSHEDAVKLIGNQFVWIPCTKSDYKKTNWGSSYENGRWDMSTHPAEYNQIEKYGGFYIGRYEAGVSTLDEKTGTFVDSVTFSNNASLFNAVSTQTSLSTVWTTAQNYNYTARETETIVATGSNKATGNVAIKANSIPYYHSDYYTAVEMSKRLYDGSNYNVQSGLVTGTQWDVMLKYMQSKGIDITDSSWGNYDKVQLNNLRGYYTNVTTSYVTDGFKSCSGLTNTNSSQNTYVLLTTGSTEQVKKMNLYDVAGNLAEWTKEAGLMPKDTTSVAYSRRSSAYNNIDNYAKAYFRAPQTPLSTYTFDGFRVVLYIK